MNRRARLSKSGIEYLDFLWDFESGCTNGCSYCWARPITVRFKDRYPNGFAPTIYPEALLSPLHLKKPSVIGVCFMGDLFDDAIDPERQIEVPHKVLPHTLRELVFGTIRQCPQHRFLFLTKQPQNLLKWSPFPENCWVGVTATDYYMMFKALNRLREIKARVKYLSLEPLLESMAGPRLDFDGIQWLIIGAQTRPYKAPEVDSVRDVIEAADIAGVSLFLKENLRWPRMTADGSPPFYIKDKVLGTWILRQQMPTGVGFGH